jgi:hypothetical protein
MPSETSLEPKRVHEIAFYRRPADELRTSARAALDTHLLPVIWALAESHDDWADFLEKPTTESLLLRVAHDV